MHYITDEIARLSPELHEVAFHDGAGFEMDVFDNETFDYDRAVVQMGFDGFKVPWLFFARGMDTAVRIGGYHMGSLQVSVHTPPAPEGVRQLSFTIRLVIRHSGSVGDEEARIRWHNPTETLHFSYTRTPGEPLLPSISFGARREAAVELFYKLRSFASEGVIDIEE